MKNRLLASLGLVALGLSLAGCDNSGKAAAEKAAALEEKLARAEQRITLLEDADEIRNLNRIYGYYLDKALYDQLVDLFTDDVSLEYSQRGVYIGKERARELMKMMPGGKAGLQPGMLQNHMQLQGVVHVEPDGKTAKGRWRALILMGNANDKTASWQDAIYENEYRKESGVWKFSKVHAYVQLNADYEKGWGKDQGPIPGINKDFPPDRPPSEVYQPYPSVYVPPFHYKNPVTGR
jgi:hypothetical protein